MAFDVQTNTTRRKGPGKLTFIAVVCILLVQGLLLLLFQYIQGGKDELGDMVATVHVQERESTVPVASMAEPVREERGDEYDAPMLEDVIARDQDEEELVDLLADIEEGAEEPPPEEPTIVREESQGVFSALTGNRKTQKQSKDEVALSVVRKEVVKKQAKQIKVIAKRQVRIVSVEQNRFPANDKADEMRILNVTLAGEKGAHGIRGGDVTLKVTFYDEVGNTGMIIPSRVQTSLNPIRMKNRKWKDNASYVLTATYMVPKGFRDNYQAKTGEKIKYYGYIVELFYQDRLQDMQARPKKLLSYAR